MIRYFFHLRTAAGIELTDVEGDELPDAVEAESHAVASARDLMQHSSLDWSCASFEVFDEKGYHVSTVWFSGSGYASCAI
ncbi:hypothetical protein JNW90_34355 [Micromonospora sp. STR1s_5]|nr:hypothetical protein [Micromonospora sp. STR1s_5]